MSKKLTFGIAVVMGSVAFCVSGKAETLNETLVSVYKSNPTLLAKRAELRATDEQVPQAASEWYPEILYKAAAGLRAVEVNTGTGTDRHQHREPTSHELTMTHSLYAGGQTVAAIDKAKNTIMAERARLAITEQDVLINAVTAYMNYYRDKEILNLNIGNEAVLTRQLEATTQRFNAGEITSTNVHQSRARLSQSVADRIKSERDLEMSRAAFYSAIGYLPENLSLPDLPPGLPGSREEAVEVAERDNFNVIAAEYDAKASVKEVDEQKGALLPTVDMEWSASRKLEASSETSRTDDYGVKLMLTVPFYQKGAEYSKLREARQTAAQQHRTAVQVRRDAARGVMEAWEALRAAQARNSSFRTQIKASRVALMGVRQEADVGSRSLLDVLDSEQEFLDSKINLAMVQRDEIIAAFELLAAMGRPLAQHIDLPVALYDPKGHFDEVDDKHFGGVSSGDITGKMMEEGKSYNLSSEPLIPIQ